MKRRLRDRGERDRSGNGNKNMTKEPRGRTDKENDDEKQTEGETKENGYIHLPAYRVCQQNTKVTTEKENTVLREKSERR